VWLLTALWRIRVVVDCFVGNTCGCIIVLCYLRMFCVARYKMSVQMDTFTDLGQGNKLCDIYVQQ